MKSGMTRRTFLGGMAGVAGAAAWPAENASDALAHSTRPNIVLILADDLGYGDLGCYGQEQIQTPHLDRLAAEGTKFTQCYAGAPVCAPSRCCLITGMHNGHGRVRDNLPHDIWLQPDDRTVAEVLKQAGYRTGAIGKWSLGNPGSWGVANFQGFDYFFGHLDQDQAHFYYPDYLWENDKIVHLRGNRGGQRGEYTCDLFTEKALAFVRENQQKPFFLYLAYTWPHWSDYDKKTPESLPVPTDDPYSQRDWPQIEKNYAAMVTRMDRDVGRLADLLKELGIEENTLFLFTSDNGPSAEAVHSPDFFESNGPLRGTKRELYEGGIRVPMIARWPGRVPANRECDQVWAFWDILPTLAELAGLPPVAGIDGISMAPALLGREQTRQHEYLYWDYAHVRGTFSQAVRAGNWKGIRNGPGAPLELYDLAQDLGETRDLSNQFPDVVERIERFVEAAYVASPDYPIAPPAVAETPGGT
ncbi:MAG: arylsulfatase [Candidatus Hydrogenedentes bacterium]|nr:arylsulfatase [Candidatus Hydrogenedentota bacterium]